MKLLKFSAQWCNPCKQQDEEFAKHPIKVPVESIDIDEDKDNLTSAYMVGSIPKMILIDGAVVINDWTGFTLSKDINDFIDGLKT